MAKRKYFTIIPDIVQFDLALTPIARILYGRILSQCSMNMNGHCTKDNSYFAEMYGMSNRNIINLINQLETLNYIEIVDKGNTHANRIIKIKEDLMTDVAMDKWIKEKNFSK